MSQSQIRPSQINNLFEKVQGGSYGKYLRKVSLKKIRGFNDQLVAFDFPVTAIVGPNGGGKTTVLGAAACAYKDIPPRRFFAKSGKLDDSMEAWSVEYEVIDKKTNAKDTTRRTASFSKLKWSRDALEREVLLFGVSRTVPANERPELTKYAVNGFTFTEDQTSKLSDKAITAIGRILGKDVASYSEININKKGRVKLLRGNTENGVSYSEFHFGAGESSIIRMITAIESSEENSLILIEEIENGLHPVATKRMVEYLIEVAERKKIQAIFTTHSNDALEPLPSKAIWTAIKDKVFQGKLDVNSLRAITGQVEANLVIFTEDDFAAEWIRAIIRSERDIPYEAIQVHGMNGDGTAVTINKYHNLNPSSKMPSICIVDGDSEQIEDNATVFRLPGEMPEMFICQSVMDGFAKFGGELAISLHKRYEDAEFVRKKVNEVLLACMDKHLIFSQIGHEIGFIPESTVKSAFLSVWCKACPSETKSMADIIRSKIKSE